MPAVQGGGICEIAISPSNQTQGESPEVGVRILREVGGGTFSSCDKLYQKKNPSKMSCFVLSSVPFRCLAKAHLASGLHMFLC